MNPGTNSASEKERRGEKKEEGKGKEKQGQGAEGGQARSETRSIEAVFGRENRSKMEETAENSGHSSPNNGDARVCFGNSPCRGGRGMHVSIMRHAFSSPLLFSFLPIDSRSAHVVHQRETFCAGAPFFAPGFSSARNRPLLQTSSKKNPPSVSGIFSSSHFFALLVPALRVQTYYISSVSLYRNLLNCFQFVISFSRKKTGRATAREKIGG